MQRISRRSLKKKHNSRLCMIFLYFCSMFSTENGRSLVFVQSLFVCQRNLANFNQQQKSNYSDHVCNRRGLFFVFCLGFARTSLTTKTGRAFFCQQRADGALKRLRTLYFVQQLTTKNKVMAAKSAISGEYIIPYKKPKAHQ